VDADVTASELVNTATVAAATADPDLSDNTARAAVAVSRGDGGEDGEDGEDGELPGTGSTVPWWAIGGGAALLGAGIVVVIVAAVRRRHRQE
jgi:hypothetical protein